MLSKLFTFLFTLITLPTVLSRLGANEYGIFLYVGASVSICEVLIDFGVPSAAGRYLADIRVNRFGLICPEIPHGRLQLVLLCIGFLPMLIIAYFVIHTSNFDTVTASQCCFITVVFNVIINFCRPCLTSLLAFKYLSVLDTAYSYPFFLAIACGFVCSKCFWSCLGCLDYLTCGCSLSLLVLNSIYSASIPCVDPKLFFLYKHA